MAGIEQDLYQVLGVRKDATLDDLKRSYRKLALKLHPDKNDGSEHASQQFKIVSSAYNILADPSKRKYYDSTGSVDDIDVSAEDWMSAFVQTMQDLTGGIQIKVSDLTVVFTVRPVQCCECCLIRYLCATSDEMFLSLHFH